MIRRKFLGLITMAGATGVAALTKAANSQGQHQTVSYQVKGFTCVTCATGLETLLGREKGVFAVKASYPSGATTVSFDPRATSEAAIRAAIEAMGFNAQPANLTKADQHRKAFTG